MPTFFIIDGIKINLYFDDHLPPHFHAIYGEFEVLLTIPTLTTYAGKIPSRQLKKVKQWAAIHIAQLQEIWDQLSGGK